VPPPYPRRFPLSIRIFCGRSVAALLLVLAGSVPASAQIFTWRAADGSLVLSNKPPAADAESVRTYAVPQASDVRATSFVPSRRSGSFDDIIDEHARRNGVRQSLVRAVIQVESAFNPFAHSPKGAMGLMQLMPATAREFGVANAYDPDQNVGAGVKYLRRLLDRYDNDERLALAAYNAGPGAVDRYGHDVPPYQETRNYVRKVLALYRGEDVVLPAIQLRKSGGASSQRKTYLTRNAQNRIVVTTALR